MLSRKSWDHGMLEIPDRVERDFGGNSYILQMRKQSKRSILLTFSKKKKPWDNETAKMID